MKRNTRGRTLASLCIAAVVAGMLAACAGSEVKGNALDNTGSSNSFRNEVRLKLDIMLPAYYKKSPEDNSPVIRLLEELTGTELHFIFVPNSSYPDNLNIALASDMLPKLTVVQSKSASFIQAVRAGTFWELGPYLQEYRNLGQANPVVLNNASIDGKTYGIYRSRTLGRMGVIIRKDWLNNLGLEIPKTIDEFYQVLKAFTILDPDGNGKDDTYGMVVSRYTGPWDTMQVWFGAPNGWGEDENGNLIPAHLTPEYMEALRFFRRLYAEGLINRDFAVMDPAKWHDPVVNGEAGVIVDVSDAASRIEGKIRRIEGLDEDQEQVMDVFGAPQGPKGRRDMPTSGYSGLIAVSKTAVKTEAELKKVLDFLDRVNDEDVQVLLGNGIAGRHFEDRGDYIAPSTDGELMTELQNLNQLLMFIPENRTRKVEQTGLREKIRELQKANEEIIIANPAEPLISDIYAVKGQQLDEFISDARTMYILGQIDEEGHQTAIEEWRRNGGDEYMEEINALYRIVRERD
ncbi:extracellular solute-binding protein [Paenibacillus tarimensis]